MKARVESARSTLNQHVRLSLALLGLALAVLVIFVPGSGAVLTGSTFEGNDGNMTIQTAGNTDWITYKDTAVRLDDMDPGTTDNSFAGGTKENPTYKEVCTGTTGHAEVIQVGYDPKVVSYEKLLDTFWDAHDPTTLNRQGDDKGTQYRSIILYSNEAQKTAAEKSKAEAQKHLKSPIVTEISPLKKFYKAEDYHQDYYRSHSGEGYCTLVIRPKVEKFEKKLKAVPH